MQIMNAPYKVQTDICLGGCINYQHGGLHFSGDVENNDRRPYSMRKNDDYIPSPQEKVRKFRIKNVNLMIIYP